MKWLAGNSPYYQRLEADDRYTVIKWVMGDGTTKYRACYRAGLVEAISDFTPDVNVARKAAEGHYAANQRKAA